LILATSALASDLSNNATQNTANESVIYNFTGGADVAVPGPVTIPGNDKL
jgi:hypothetical protein